MVSSLLSYGGPSKLIVEKNYGLNICCGDYLNPSR